MFRLSLFIFLLYCTNSIILFFFPLYLQDVGMNADRIGFVIAAGSLMTIFARPFWGYVCDRNKTVKRVLFITLIGALLTSFGLFSLEIFMWLVLFNLLFYLFNSAWIPLTDTLTLSFAHRHGYHYGVFRMWGSIGGGLSAFLLGMFTDALGTGSLIWIHTAILCVALFAFVGLEDVDKARKPVTMRSLGRFLSNGTMIWFLLAALTVSIPHRMNDSMLSLFMSDLGASDTQLGLAWMVATFSSVPVLYFSGPIIHKYGELKVFVFAALLYVLRWTVYSIAPGAGALIAAQLLHSITFPLFFVASIQFLLRISPDELRSTGQTVFASVFGGLGGIFGLSIGGWGIEMYGFHAVYFCCAVLVVLGLGFVWPVWRRVRKAEAADEVQKGMPV